VDAAPADRPTAHLRAVVVPFLVRGGAMARSPDPFAMIPATVFDRLRGDGRALAVYCVLARHADRSGACWPKVESICDAVGWSKPTVIAALRRLRAAGLVESEARWSRGSVTANSYRLLPHRPVNHVDRTGQGDLPVPVNGIDATGQPPLRELEPNEREPSEPRGDAPPPPPARAGYPPDFETFWAQYPAGHGNKKRTAEVWTKLGPGADERATIMAGLARWNACGRWRRGFVRDATAWLRDRWWEDDPPAADAEPSGVDRDGKPASATDYFVRVGKGEP
jgi:DNA-binding transcriptional ArsR family regulator